MRCSICNWLDIHDRTIQDRPYGPNGELVRLCDTCNDLALYHRDRPLAAVLGLMANRLRQVEERTRANARPNWVKRLERKLDAVERKLDTLLELHRASRIDAEDIRWTRELARKAVAGD